MAAKKRTPAQRARDLVRTAQLYLQGVTQLEISKEIGVSRVQITQDLKEIRAWWKDRTSMDLDAYRAEQLARLDNLEAQYWKSWEDSRKPMKSKTASKTTVGKQSGITASERTISSYGDVRFLNGVADTIAERCKILGLFAPTKLTGVFTHDHDYTDEQVDAIAAIFTKRKN